MDFVVIGFGLGALILILAIAIRDLAPKLRQTPPLPTQTDSVNRFGLPSFSGIEPADWQTVCRAAARALLLAGTAVLLVTLIAIAAQVEDRLGARVVLATALIAFGLAAFRAGQVADRRLGLDRRARVRAASTADILDLDVELEFEHGQERAVTVGDHTAPSGGDADDAERIAVTATGDSVASPASVEPDNGTVGAPEPAASDVEESEESADGAVPESSSENEAAEDPVDILAAFAANGNVPTGAAPRPETSPGDSEVPPTPDAGNDDAQGVQDGADARDGEHAPPEGRDGTKLDEVEPLAVVRTADEHAASPLEPASLAVDASDAEDPEQDEAARSEHAAADAALPAGDPPKEVAASTAEHR